ncbi:hypothetical protein TcWFU_003034 [Taenia crassiceps]|uniref:Uncharacterized protein n=1 Tax=Taenia crassiceps TaxID=6207 RepID=A0ABR4QGJ1_9CEST
MQLGEPSPHHRVTTTSPLSQRSSSQCIAAEVVEMQAKEAMYGNVQVESNKLPRFSSKSTVCQDGGYVKTMHELGGNVAASAAAAAANTHEHSFLISDCGGV